MAAAAADPAGVVHGWSELVSRGPWRVRARPRPDSRVSADDLVLRYADLLSGDATAGRRCAVSDEEPDIRAGARLPRDSAGPARAGVRHALEILAALGGGVRAGARLVL